jgi:Leucine-rich repeat (LRR) protein
MVETKITEIPKSITQLSKLHTLDLRNCIHLNSGIENIYGLKNLRHVCIKSYTPFPEEIGNLNKLEHLHVDHLKDEYHIEQLYRLASLKELSLGGKEFTALPSGISALKNLEKITIAMSPVKRLPEDLSLVPLKVFKYIMLWLYNFELVDNKRFIPDLEQMFQVLSKIKTLKEIVLNKNGINTLPKNISLLKQLEKLYLGELLQEETIPKELMELNNLKELKVVLQAANYKIFQEIEKKIPGIKITI